ncbi:MAG: heavy metal translocating P-type ATPase, partial [Lachnospiraceae bacterium]|nr:heavy metal translocating P-type ATPase [Lachnospiraceae bacterium]
MSTKIYMLENLGCAHCAAKMEEKIGEISGIEQVSLTFATKQLRITAEEPDKYLEEIRKICTSIESQVQVVPREIHAKVKDEKVEEKKQLGDLPVILVGAVLFIFGNMFAHFQMSNASLMVFIIAYLVLGGKILLEAVRNISHGQIFDENFLMCIATIG